MVPWGFIKPTSTVTFIYFLSTIIYWEFSPKRHLILMINLIYFCSCNLKFNSIITPQVNASRSRKSCVWWRTCRRRYNVENIVSKFHFCKTREWIITIPINQKLVLYLRTFNVMMASIIGSYQFFFAASQTFIIYFSSSDSIYTIRWRWRYKTNTEEVQWNQHQLEVSMMYHLMMILQFAENVIHLLVNSLIL